MYRGRDRLPERAKVGHACLRLYCIHLRPDAGVEDRGHKCAGGARGQLGAAEQPLVQRVGHLQACSGGGHQASAHGPLGCISSPLPRRSKTSGQSLDAHPNCESSTGAKSASDGLATTLFDKSGKKVGETTVKTDAWLRAENAEAAQEIRLRIPLCGRRSRPRSIARFRGSAERKDCRSR